MLKRHLVGDHVMRPKILRNTPEEEARIQAGIALDPDNPEWTEGDFNAATRPGLRRPPTLEEVMAAPRAS